MISSDLTCGKIARSPISCPGTARARSAMKFSFLDRWSAIGSSQISWSTRSQDILGRVKGVKDFPRHQHKFDKVWLGLEALIPAMSRYRDQIPYQIPSGGSIPGTSNHEQYWTLVGSEVLYHPAWKWQLACHVLDHLYHLLHKDLHPWKPNPSVHCIFGPGVGFHCQAVLAAAPSTSLQRAMLSGGDQHWRQLSCMWREPLYECPFQECLSMYVCVYIFIHTPHYRHTDSNRPCRNSPCLPCLPISLASPNIDAQLRVDQALAAGTSGLVGHPALPPLGEPELRGWARLSPGEEGNPWNLDKKTTKMWTQIGNMWETWEV